MQWRSWIGRAVMLGGLGSLLFLAGVASGQDTTRNSEYWLGLAPEAPIPAPLRVQLKLLERQGLLVLAVAPSSPAAAAKIERFDILLKANNTALAKVDDLLDAIDAAQGKKLTLEIVREAKRITVDVVPAKRPPEARPRPRDLIGDQFPADPQWEQMRAILEQLQTGRMGQPMRFRFVQPGVLLPPGTEVPSSVPDDVTIQVTKRGKQPASVVVSRGDKKWEVTEDSLEKLPKELRPCVERMLGRYSLGTTHSDTLDWQPDAGRAPPSSAPHRKPQSSEETPEKGQ